MQLQVVDHPQVPHTFTVHQLTAFQLTVCVVQDADSPDFGRRADELIAVSAPQSRGRADPAGRFRDTRRDDLPGPTAEAGSLPRVRGEARPRGNTHAARQPGDLSGRQVPQVDLMLASGGTLKAAIRLVFDCGTDDVPAFCLLDAPEGQRRCRATSATRRL